MANLQSLKKLWAGNSNTLTGMVLLALIVLVASTVWLQSPGEQPDAVDILQADLSRTEQNQIRLTLARGSLNEFRFENNRLMVPPALQSSYLQTLLDAGTLPESLQGPNQELPTVNPFLSRSQQELVQQNHRQQKLRSLLVQLPFVEDARVQLDSQQGMSAFAAPDIRCVVSIRPTGQLILEQQQLATIHQNILAAVAGITADRIVINDLNSGSAWDSTQISMMDSENCAPQVNRLRLLRKMEHELKHSLTGWPGVGFSVEICQSCPTGMEQMGSPLILPETRNTIQRNLPPGSNSSMKVPAISVGHVAVPDQRTVPDQVKIRLTVDSHAITDFLQQQRAGTDSGIWWGNDNNPVVDSVAVRERMKHELESHIRRQLTHSGQSADQENEIAVEFASPLPMQSGLPGGRRTFWSPANQGMVWAILPGVALCVLVVVSMSRRRVARPVAASVAQKERPDVWLDDNLETVNRQQIRQKIDELIENNPEAAARVIQSWIRDSA